MSTQSVCNEQSSRRVFGSSFSTAFKELLCSLLSSANTVRLFKYICVYQAIVIKYYRTIRQVVVSTYIYGDIPDIFTIWADFTYTSFCHMMLLHSISFIVTGFCGEDMCITTASAVIWITLICNLLGHWLISSVPYISAARLQRRSIIH
jgi:hypothetical protein